MKRSDFDGHAGSRQASRRRFLRKTSEVAAATALAQVTVPHVHAADDDRIRLALIGCGGRGTGAAANAFEATGGPVSLYAMADLFSNRLDAAHKVLTTRYSNQVEVSGDRKFVGFDAYKHAIDCLRPGDVAMLTGYAGWRPVQLEYAIDKGVHVFMEKSFATDPVGVRRVIQAGERAKRKNLKVAAGLMCRHSRNRQELIRRIRDGALGEIQMVRAYRMQPVGPLPAKPMEEDELAWQIRNFVCFFWVSGGLFAEMDIHQIDEICWVKDAWPTSAHGIGGRCPDSADRSQNLDSYGVEWTFPDGTKAHDVVRYLPGCHNEFATYVHGTKCAAQFSGNVHAGTVQIYKDQRCSSDNVIWKMPDEEITPWQAEWNVFLEAIRDDRPHLEAERAALSNLADIMGRAAVHTGKVVTWDQAMNSSFQWCPELDQLNEHSPPPLQANDRGYYPAPIPGSWSEI